LNISEVSSRYEFDRRFISRTTCSWSLYAKVSPPASVFIILFCRTDTGLAFTFMALWSYCYLGLLLKLGLGWGYGLEIGRYRLYW